MERFPGWPFRFFLLSHHSEGLCQLRCPHRPAENDGKFFAAMDVVLRERSDARFVLATDSEETESAFVDRYGARIVCHPKASRARGEAEAIRDALVDLLLLARCSRLIGTFSSTFSEVAWWMGGCRARVTIIS